MPDPLGYHSSPTKQPHVATSRRTDHFRENIDTYTSNDFSEAGGERTRGVHNRPCDDFAITARVPTKRHVTYRDTSRTPSHEEALFCGDRVAAGRGGFLPGQRRKGTNASEWPGGDKGCRCRWQTELDVRRIHRPGDPWESASRACTISAEKY